MRNKIIFLGIDGVLNTYIDFHEMLTFGHPINNNTKVINRGLLSVLHKIIEYTDAKIVISSPWKLVYPLQQIHDFFVQHGWKYSIDSIIDHTPNLNKSVDHDLIEDMKGREISQYIDNNISNIENFVIIDYNCKTFKNEKFVKNVDYFQTDPHHGLTLLIGSKITKTLGYNQKTIQMNEQYQKTLDKLNNKLSSVSLSGKAQDL